jgi:8-hydroxy-5-deazaflavin:NADPH oxidoreductase
MARFTIFGTGNMGSAIGSVLTDGGSTVTHVSQGGGGTVDGDVVILAVPYHALSEIVAQYGDQLRGKVVVDITNPLNFETFDSLVVPVGSSAAAELAAKLPDSSVLKAFNTNFAATLASKKVGNETTTVLVAGDDDAGKQVLVTALEAGGVSAIDAGSLARAHELEAMGFLQLTLAAGEKLPWTGGFAVAR